MRMEYSYTKGVIGHNATYGSEGYEGTYEVKGNSIRITFTAREGWLDGYLKATAYYEDDPDFTYHMEGDFRLHALNSKIILDVLIPNFSSNKDSLIAVTFCNATYDRLLMDFNSTSISDPQDKKAMDGWLSRALHDTLSEAYCLAIRDDLRKGTESAAFLGIVRELLSVVFGSFVGR